MSKTVALFDIWRPGYGGAVVSIYAAGTTNLATVFKDETLTIPADNPMVLMSRGDTDGTNYGKFEYPIYTGVAYVIRVDATEETGIMRPPLNNLIGEDASEALVTPNGSDYSSTLADLMARTVTVENYGSVIAGDGGSAATNTATIQLAISALTSGGEVFISTPGVIKVNQLDIPQDVVLRGRGKSSTSLQSILGDISFVLNGPRAGFRQMTLDGNSLVPASTGVYSVGNDEIIFDGVTIQRFETNLHVKGGQSFKWDSLTLDNAVTGAKLHGDTNASGVGGGGPFQDLLWTGGAVTNCSTNGLHFAYEDALCQNGRLIGVRFGDNTGTALNIRGAQFINYDNSTFENNTVNVHIEDDDTVLTGANEADNKVISISFNGGRMDEGKFEATGTNQEVSLKGMSLTDVTFDLQTPIDNPIQLIDCTESGVVITGEGTKILRSRTADDGESFGITTGNVATKAWSLPLAPGQIVYLEGKVLGKQRNGEGRAVYHISAGAYRPGSTLAYDTQTANFTIGGILTGGSSGAKARIVNDVDGGTTGTLTLTDIVGDFLDNEILTDESTGSATANGVLVIQNASLDTVGVTTIRTAYETDAAWAAVFVANGPEIELRVTGNTSATVEWTANVNVVTT